MTPDGGGGNDILDASGTGGDSLSGGDGNDFLTGAGTGAYTLDGGNNDDRFRLQGGGAEVGLGGAGNDFFLASGIGNYSIDGGTGDITINVTEMAMTRSSVAPAWGRLAERHGQRRDILMSAAQLVITLFMTATPARTMIR